MNKFLLLFSIILVLNICVFLQTAPPKDDFQFWGETTVFIPIVKRKNSADKEVEKLVFFINGALRIGRNISRPVDERIGFGFEYYANKYLTLTPSYLYRAGQPFEGRKEYEHRARFDLTLGNKWSKFSLKDRSRFEYRIRNFRSDSVRYRNKLQLSIPVKKSSKEIFTSFVATEPFYDFQAKQWTRNEFSAGITKKFSDNFTADFFFLLQKNRGNVLKTINAFVVNFKIKID
ncbi:MAG: DUF2490 domain-containing protein [Acidobacteriota bacterium]|nr:DUF2490 domain-containing protein [Acidobacteriota bacterium]